MGERGCEGPSAAVLNRELHWYATLDRHLVEVASARLLHILLSTVLATVTAAVFQHVVGVVGVFSATFSLILDILLYLSLELLGVFSYAPDVLLVSHFTRRTASRMQLVVPTVKRAIGALDHLVAQLTPDERLRGQYARLVLHRRPIVFQGIASILVLLEGGNSLVCGGHWAESGHRRIHLVLMLRSVGELVRLGAAEEGRVHPMEQLFGFLSRGLLGLRVNKRTFPVATDVLFNHLLFLLHLVLAQVRLPVTIHGHPTVMQCGKLPIVNG